MNSLPFQIAQLSGHLEVQLETGILTQLSSRCRSSLLQHQGMTCVLGQDNFCRAIRPQQLQLQTLGNIAGIHIAGQIDQGAGQGGQLVHHDTAKTRQGRLSRVHRPIQFRCHCRQGTALRHQKQAACSSASRQALRQAQQLRAGLADGSNRVSPTQHLHHIQRAFIRQDIGADWPGLSADRLTCGFQTSLQRMGLNLGSLIKQQQPLRWSDGFLFLTRLRGRGAGQKQIGALAQFLSGRLLRGLNLLKTRLFQSLVPAFRRQQGGGSRIPSSMPPALVQTRQEVGMPIWVTLGHQQDSTLSQPLLATHQGRWNMHATVQAVTQNHDIKLCVVDLLQLPFLQVKADKLHIGQSMVLCRLTGLQISIRQGQNIFKLIFGQASRQSLGQIARAHSDFQDSQSLGSGQVRSQFSQLGFQCQTHAQIHGVIVIQHFNHRGTAQRGQQFFA